MDVPLAFNEIIIRHGLKGRGKTSMFNRKADAGKLSVLLGKYKKNKDMKSVNSQNEMMSICDFCRFFIGMLLAFMSLGLNASTIHWITFINTDDPNVGELDKNARSALYGRFIHTVNSELSQYGYECNILDYYSDSFSSAECTSCISNLKCSPTDIVVFYFIGHGFRPIEINVVSKYPYMLFDENCNNSIPLSWVHQSLKNKGARLTLSFGVCGNSYQGANCKPSIEEALLPSIAKHEANTSSDGNSDSAIANAFLGYKGDMVICSAFPGQHTWGGQTELGSMDIFTYSLVTLFDKAQSEKVLSWPAILEELSLQISNATKDLPVNSIQTPTYDFNLKQVQMPELKGESINTPIEEIDSASYEYIRLRAHEKVMRFMDYYHAIADKHVDMEKKKHYIQCAAELFLPQEGVIRLTRINNRQSRKTVQPVKNFLEKVANGMIRGEPNVTAWEFCHNYSQRPLSEKEAEVIFCKHGDNMRKNGNMCIMPNGYVTCTMPILGDKDNLFY